MPFPSRILLDASPLGPFFSTPVLLVPVVRHTGGLRDTVFDVDTDKVGGNDGCSWRVGRGFRPTGMPAFASSPSPLHLLHAPSSRCPCQSHLEPDHAHPQARAAWEVAGSTDPEADGPSCVNGFAFEGTDPGSLDWALNRAIDAYYNDKAWFRGLQAQVMRLDWSWNRPALQYVDLYYAATKN
jgi:glycogen synthase